MKKLVLLFLIVLIMPAYAENLISEGFEDLSLWNAEDYNKCSSITAEDNVLKIESNAENHAYVWKNVPVQPGRIYKFSAEIKTENVADTGNGALLGIYYRIAYSGEVRGTTEDFVPAEIYFTTDGKNVPIMLSLGGYSSMTSGTAYFKNAAVEEVNEVPQGAAYYKYDKETEGAEQRPKEFDGRWYLLCILLAAALIGGGLCAFGKREREDGKLWQN